MSLVYGHRAIQRLINLINFPAVCLFNNEFLFNHMWSWWCILIWRTLGWVGYRFHTNEDRWLWDPPFWSSTPGWMEYDWGSSRFILCRHELEQVQEAMVSYLNLLHCECCLPVHFSSSKSVLLIHYFWRGFAHKGLIITYPKWLPDRQQTLRQY